LERLLDLKQDDKTPIYEAVADLAYAPGGSALLEQRIRAGAWWRDGIVEILAKRDFDPVMLVRWSAPDPKLQWFIINRVVEKTSPEADTYARENCNREVLPDEIGVLNHRSRTLQKGRTRHEILVA
jgi:hypothetical protein